MIVDFSQLIKKGEKLPEELELSIEVFDGYEISVIGYVNFKDGFAYLSSVEFVYDEDDFVEAAVQYLTKQEPEFEDEIAMSVTSAFEAAKELDLDADEVHFFIVKVDEEGRAVSEPEIFEIADRLDFTKNPIIDANEDFLETFLEGKKEKPKKSKKTTSKLKR